MSLHTGNTSQALSPFQLNNRTAYLKWREEHLHYHKPRLNDVQLEIKDPHRLSLTEKQIISDCCEKYNFAIYQLQDDAIQDKSLVHALGKQTGLHNLDTNLRADEDKISSIEVREQAGNQYIPYTSRGLSWHTDGYYNPLDKQIFGIIMHCVAPAFEGGVNRFLNPEDVYIELRDHNPDFIAALMHPQAMTVPENTESGKVLRKAQSGPVFMIRPGGRLHMRYTARKRNIVWRDTEDTAGAVSMISDLLADDDKVLKIGLKAGQGIICNNVLHNRSGFEDGIDHKRLMYRARYYDAVGS